MCIGNVFSKYREHANVAYRDHLLWWIDGGDYINSHAQR